MKRSIITLTTDFGTRDGFVGQMKGVILSINPFCEIVDVTHDIAPFAVREAALVLKGIARYFPQGTIHITVVDPGVGSERKPIAVRTENGIFVGPDNGVFSWILSHAESWQAREIKDETLFMPNPHPTFHGRDVFAPVAAHVSAGRNFESLGPLVEDPVVLRFPGPQETSSGILGEIIYVDRFGNMSTNIEGTMLTHTIRGIRVAQTRIPRLSRCFSDAPVGTPVALVNSFGLLEIGINGGRATDELEVDIGDYVSVDWD